MIVHGFWSCTLMADVVPGMIVLIYIPRELYSVISLTMASEVLLSVESHAHSFGIIEDMIKPQVLLKP